MPGDLGVPEAVCLLLGGKQLDILAQRALVAFEGEDVIGLLVEDFLGDVALAAHGVDGDDGALDRQHVEKRRDGDDLVGLVRHFDLAEHEALARREGRHHMDRGFSAFLVGGAAQRLTVDGDHIRRHADQLGNPGDEATLEFRSVEGRENVAEVVVRGRPVPERQEPAKKLDLLLAEPRDIDEGFRSGKHCEQAQQQHLFERIDHLAALPRIGEICKTLQKNKRFAVRPKSRTRLHRVLRQSESEDHDRFSTSAICHELLHPITLEAIRDGIDSRIRAAVKGDAGSIASALITGKRDALSAPVFDAMFISGVGHVLSISGYHMALVAGVVFFIVRAVLALFPALALRYPIKKWAAMAALAAATFYLVLSRAEVATQRSDIMTARTLIWRTPQSRHPP